MQECGKVKLVHAKTDKPTNSWLGVLSAALDDVPESAGIF